VRTATALVAASMLVLGASTALAQTLSSRPSLFDCVIEPRAMINVGSSADGILDEIAVDRGDHVEKGQVLARLEASLAKVEVEIAQVRADADADLLSSKARLEHLSRRAGRVAELFSRKVASAESRDEAMTEKLLAEHGVRESELNRKLRAVELKRAREVLARRTIRSPVTGIVHQRLMAPGEFVHEQVAVLTLAEIDPLNVEVFLPISLYGKVRLGMAAEVMPVAPVGGVHKATVTVVDQVFDAASGTLGVRLELPNPDFKLPAGLACSVRFATD